MPLACQVKRRKPEARATLRKFPPVPAPTPRRSIRRTENISPGDRKRAPALKPINGGSSCKIDKLGTRAKSRKALSIRSEASAGRHMQVKSSSRQSDVASLRSFRLQSARIGQQLQRTT